MTMKRAGVEGGTMRGPAPRWLVPALVVLAAASAGARLQPPGPLAELVGMAVLPADTFGQGPPSGEFRANGARGSRFPAQPVQGVSAILPAPGPTGAWFALSDNGYGVRWNSPDYLLCWYVLRPAWRTAAGGAGTVTVERIVRLSDPSRLVPFRLTREDSPERWLTGSDFDPESAVGMADGSFWVGDEFGPFLLHVDGTGTLLAAPVGIPGYVSSDNPALPPAEAGAANVALVRRSRGFEALAPGLRAGTLLALLEGATVDASAGEARMLEFDTATRAFTGRSWRYVLAQPGQSTTEMVRYAEGRYLVIERDHGHGPAAAFKRVFAVRLGDPQQPVEKVLVADLLEIADPGRLGGGGSVFTFPFVTTEAVWPEDRHTLVLVNDNNFPAEGGRLAGQRDGTEFVRLRLRTPLPLD